MRRFLFGTRRRKVLAAVVTALTLSGAALAAWVITVNGPSGRGGIATLQNPTVSYPATAPANDCFPGASCSVTFDVSNPNSYALVLTAWNTNGGTPGVEKPIGTSNIAQCPASNVTANALSGLNISIPAGSSTHTLPGAYTLASNAPTQCAGSFVTFGSGGTTYTFSTP